MLALLFFAVLHVIFFSIGALFVSFLLPKRMQLRWFIAPTIGYAFASVMITLLYRAGMMMDSIFLIMLGLAGVGVAWIIRAVWTARGSGPAAVPWWKQDAIVLLSLAFIASMILMAPQWTGGNRFAVFQGNQWDGFGYLNAAVVFSKESHAAIAAATDADMLKNPFLAFGKGNLDLRNSVHLLYACVGKSFPRNYHDLTYSFLIVLMVQSILTAMFLLRNLVPTASALSVSVVALVFPLGFWGQYVFDINAWSQLSSIAVLLAISGFCLLAYPRRDIFDTGDSRRIALLFVILCSGALYLYPESLAFHIPAFLAVLAAAVVRNRASGTSISVQVAMLSGMTGGLASGVLFYKGTIGFMVDQFTSVLATSAEWWRYFMAYMFGRDGVNESLLANTADAVGGVFGLYFLTPARNLDRASAFFARLLILIIASGLVMTLYRAVTSSRRAKQPKLTKQTDPSNQGDKPDRNVFFILSIFNGVLLAGTTALLFLGKFWSMNKALSYEAPYLMIVLMLPLLFLRTVSTVSRIVLIVFAFIQIGMGPVRVIAAGDQSGIHYALPYPSCQEPMLKTFDWDLTKIADDIDRARSVAVDLRNRWVENYVMVYLYSIGKPFTPVNPVNTYFGAGRDLGRPPLPPDIDAVIAFDAFGALRVLPAVVKKSS